MAADGSNCVAVPSSSQHGTCWNLTACRGSSKALLLSLSTAVAGHQQPDTKKNAGSAPAAAVQPVLFGHVNRAANAAFAFALPIYASFLSAHLFAVTSVVFVPGTTASIYGVRRAQLTAEYNGVSEVYGIVVSFLFCMVTKHQPGAHITVRVLTRMLLSRELTTECCHCPHFT